MTKPIDFKFSAERGGDPQMLRSHYIFNEIVSATTICVEQSQNGILGA